MHSAPRIVTTSIGPALIIQETRNHDRTIPLSAIAAYRELLGYSDPVEVVDAIVHMIDAGTPDPDPETGENVWSQPFRVLEAREAERGTEAVRAESEGHNRDEIVQRSEQAAYAAVHEPIDGGECLMDRVRRDVRARLGCAEPSRKCGVETRTQPAVMSAKPTRLERVFQPLSSRRAMVQEVLEAQLPALTEATQMFLHSLSGQEHDPLVEPKPEGPKPATLDQIKAKYQEGA